MLTASPPGRTRFPGQFHSNPRAQAAADSRIAASAVASLQYLWGHVGQYSRTSAVRVVIATLR
jgi:hypothetical protein